MLRSKWTICTLLATTLLHDQTMQQADGQLEEKAVTLDAVAQTWKKRTERIKTFRLQWDMQKTVTKGFYHLPTAGGGDRLNPENRTVPPHDVVREQSFRLMMDGIWLRFFRKQDGVRASGEMASDLIDTVGVREGFKSLSMGESIAYPKCQIGTSSTQFHPNDVNSQILTPVLMCVRPFHPLITIFANFPEGFEIAAGRYNIAGRPCLMLTKHPTGDGGRKMSIWVDEDRDYAIVRLSKYRHAGTLSHQYTVHEYVSSDAGWFPQRWERILHDDSGNVKLSESATSTSFAVNVPIDASEFELEIPPGTLVEDGRTKERYILKEGGEKRIVLREEILANLSFDELLATETGERIGARNSADGNRQNSRTQMLVIANVVLVIVLLGVWWMKSRAQRTRPT